MPAFDFSDTLEAGFSPAGDLQSSPEVRLKATELYFNPLLILSNLAEVCLRHTKELPASCKAYRFLGKGVLEGRTQAPKYYCQPSPSLRHLPLPCSPPRFVTLVAPLAGVRCPVLLVGKAGGAHGADGLLTTAANPVLQQRSGSARHLTMFPGARQSPQASRLKKKEQMYTHHARTPGGRLRPPPGGTPGCTVPCPRVSLKVSSSNPLP